LRQEKQLKKRPVARNGPNVLRNSTGPRGGEGGERPGAGAGIAASRVNDMRATAGF
jgi:hypothetical protein